MRDHALILPPLGSEVDETLACIAWPMTGQSVLPKPGPARKAFRLAQAMRAAERKADERDLNWLRWERVGVDIYSFHGWQREWFGRVPPDAVRWMSVRQIVGIHHVSHRLADAVHRAFR